MELTRVALAVTLAAALAGCSGGKRKAVEDARRPAPASDGATGGSATGSASGSATPAALGPYRVDAQAKTGDVQIRVEWKDAPQALRVPGRSAACGRATLPALLPTTTWGVPDAFVSIEVDHGKAMPALHARVVVDDCTVTPRLAVAGSTLTIASALEKPATVTIADGGGTPRTLYLPIVGHELEVTLTPGAVHTVTYAADQVASVVSASSPYVAITEATGQVILRDVPVGTHAVRAWLPARGALEARAATGSVTVSEGALAEVTVDISAP